MPERDLPLNDYDHLPAGSLISRIRTLDAAGLQTLLDYERATPTGSRWSASCSTGCPR